MSASQAEVYPQAGGHVINLPHEGRCKTHENESKDAEGD